VRGARPTLVVAPTSVLANWAAEAARFAPRWRVSTYHGPARALDPAADLTITSYALLRLDVDALCAVDWDSVVLDESQAIKNGREPGGARGASPARRFASRSRNADREPASPSSGAVPLPVARLARQAARLRRALCAADRRGRPAAARAAARGACGRSCCAG